MSSIFAAFASRFGKHNLKSLGKDFKLDKATSEAKKFAKKQTFTTSNHSTLYDVGLKVGDLMAGPSIKIASNVDVKVVESALNNFISDTNRSSALTEHNLVTTDTLIVFTTTNVHIGKTTTDRIRKMANLTLVQVNRKYLSQSMKDYIQHNKRSQLYLQSGFNEKSFSFMMEDTFFTC